LQNPNSSRYLRRSHAGLLDELFGPSPR
jgi:hypothetical protein